MVHQGPLLIKSAFFIYFVALGCLVPFLALVLQNVGLSPIQIGIVMAARPTAGIISPILFGIIADSLRRVKPALLVAVLAAPLFLGCGLALRIAYDGYTNRTVVDGTSNYIDGGIPNTLSNTIVFWSFLFVITSWAFFDGSINPLLDSITMSLIDHDGAERIDFGRQRAFGTIGFGLATVGSGLMQNFVHLSVSNDVLMMAVTIVLGLGLGALILLCYNDNTPTMEQPRFLVGLRSIVRSADMVMLFLAMTVLGFCNGFISIFYAVLIEDMHGSALITGVSYTIACATELVVILNVRAISRFLHGYRPTLLLALFLQGARTVGLSYATSPYFGFLFSFFNCFVFGTVWPMVIEHLTARAPNGMVATYTGLLYGLYCGVAAAAAMLAGGSLQQRFGVRQTFFIVGITGLAFSLVYSGYMILRRCCGRQHLTDDSTDSLLISAKVLDEDDISVVPAV